MGNFEFVRDLRGDNTPPALIDLPVAASQTILVDDLLVLSSGQLIKATASVALPCAVAAHASTGAAAGTLIRVYPIQPGQVWKAIADADATASVLTTRVFDINNTAGQTVDIGDAANGSIGILALRPGSTTAIEVFFSLGYFF